MKRVIATALLASALISAGCGHASVPKPKGYFRIDLPQKSYVHFDSPCSYSIEYPQYAVINLHPATATDTCAPAGAKKSTLTGALFQIAEN